MKKLFASLLALALLSGSAYADAVNVMAAFTRRSPRVAQRSGSA
jgi:hypothetical protein